MIAPCREAGEDRGLRENVDSASNATTEETETVDEALPPPSTVVLEERLNQRAAHYLTTLTVDNLKTYNPPSKHHCKTENDFRLALKKLNAFLSTFVGKEDGTQCTYRYARGKGFGRKAVCVGRAHSCSNRTGGRIAIFGRRWQSP